jgi:CubicO group peptidase (beta-lactamase class C family)
LRLRLVATPDGAAKIISLDQGGVEIPAVATIAADKVAIDAPSVHGRFEGRLAGDRIAGVWTQGGPLPLVFVRGETGEPPPPPAPVTQAQLHAWRTESGSPALAAAVAKKSAAPKFWVDGVRIGGGDVAATVDDQWHIGSITKSFTATLVARLVEAGKIAWDDTVGDVLGAVAPNMRPAYRPVTFRHLLSHRSGLPGNIPPADFIRFARVNPDAREERRAYVRIALAMAPKGPAGATFEYANNGYVTAGAMLEVRCGARWEDLMAAHVFAPLGLASAGFGAPGVAGRTDQPVGHAKGPGGERVPFPPGGAITDNPVVLGPAGTIHLTLADLLTYLAAHRDAPAFLKPESWRTLHEPPFGGDYAMGWVVRPDGARWHNGSNTLWYAEAQFSAATGTVAAAAANDGAPEGAQAVARALGGALAAA